jgi:uncharacterized coiled-coil protein SlyX
LLSQYRELLETSKTHQKGKLDELSQTVAALRQEGAAKDQTILQLGQKEAYLVQQVVEMQV